MSKVLHAISLDVEDYLNGELLRVCGRLEPPTQDVVRYTEEMLDLFAEFDVTSTCFILGEVAETYPNLVRRIQAEGHEVAVHGWHHQRIFQLRPAEFRETLYRAKCLLEDLSGQAVLGYRAVAMSLNRRTQWAYGIISELGFQYSSSVYPFRHKNNVLPDAPAGPHVVTTQAGARVLEIPLSVVKLGPVRLPALGGGYLRHFPLLFSHFALAAIERGGRRAVVYLHPYELDVHTNISAFPFYLSSHEKKRIEKALPSQLRNRRHTRTKIRSLLSRASFGPVNQSFHDELEAFRAQSELGGLKKYQLRSSPRAANP